MAALLKGLLVVWLIGYPLLPIGPAVAYMIANVVGPPFVTATVNANGWRDVGPVTPTFVAVTIGIPWLVGLIVLGLGVALASRSDGEKASGN